MSLDVQNEEKLLTAQEAGNLAGLSAVYFSDRAKGRRQPMILSYRFGNRLRFKKSDIISYIASHLKPTPKE